MTGAGGPAVKIVFAAPTAPRPFSAKVVVQTGMPALPQATLPVSGNVSADLVSDRMFVSFPATPQGQAGAGLQSPVVEVRLSSLSGCPFKVRSVRLSGGVVTGKAAPDGRDVKVVLRLAGAPAKANGVIRIETDRADQPTLEVRYAARAAAPAGRLPVRPSVPAAPRCRRFMQLLVAVNPNGSGNPRG